MNEYIYIYRYIWLKVQQFSARIGFKQAAKYDRIPIVLSMDFRLPTTYIKLSDWKRTSETRKKIDLQPKEKEENGKHLI